MRRNRLPPPTQFTRSDKYRFVLGFAAIFLGITILWRTLAIAISPPAILVGVAFVGFGAYRLWLGFTRLQQFRNQRNRSS